MEACQFYNRRVNFIMKGVSMPSEQLAEWKSIWVIEGISKTLEAFHNDLMVLNDLVERSHFPLFRAVELLSAAQFPVVSLVHACQQFGL